MSRSSDALADVRTREQFAAALTALRERSGQTVRDLAAATDIPFSTVGGYLSGRHLPTAGQIPRLRDLLRACDVTDPVEINEWLSACARVRGSRHGPRKSSPYPGLEPYRRADADRFFGREAATQRILDLIDGLAADPGPSKGILAVVGPSGSGKSSLLRAGVAAAIDSGALDSPDERWSCTVVTPGSDPNSALRAARSAIADTNRGVVVLDQFEEVFTAVAAAAVRAHFLHDLAEFARTTPVVIGLRADFYAAAAREPAVLPALAYAQVLVGPLSAEQLREVIVAPAAQAGVIVEDGLVDLLLADLAPHDAPGHDHDAGSLPLLSHALLATWTRSDGARLGVADYRETGGIDAAVQRTAEQTFTMLSPGEQDLARRVFVRLVHLDDLAVTRRRVTRTELDDLRSTGADAGSVIEAFVEARLLTASESLVEISHEALLTAWPRLHDWVDLDRGGLRVHRQITNASSEWERLGRDQSGLARGVRLESMLEWTNSDDHGSDLTDTEQFYIDASRRQRDADRVLARRRTQRLRTLAAAALTLALVAGVLAVLALRSQGRADRARDRATEVGAEALSGQVAFQARQLRSRDPALAAQLAIAAYRIAPTANAQSVLIDQSAAPAVARLLGAPGPTPLAHSADGRVVAVGHADDGSVQLVSRSATGVLHRTVRLPGTSPRQQVFALAFDPRGHWLAVGGSSGDLRLMRTDTADAQAVTLTHGSGQGIEAIAITPDGHTLLAGSSAPTALRAWDITDPTHPTPKGAPAGLPATTTVMSLALSTDGRMLAASGTAGGRALLAQWQLGATGRFRPARLRWGGTGLVNNAVAYSRDGQHLAIGATDGTVHIERVTTGRLVRTLSTPGSAKVNVLAYNADGSRIAVGVAAGSVRQYSTADGVVLSESGTPGPVTGLAYLSGSDLLDTAADGALRSSPVSAAMPVAGVGFGVAFNSESTREVVTSSTISGGDQLWDVADPLRPRAVGARFGQLPSLGGASGAGALTRNGDTAAVASATGKVALFDLSDSGHPRQISVMSPSGALIEALAFSPDGRLLAEGGDDNMLRVLDLADRAHPKVVATVPGTNLVLGVTFSPDGRYLAAASADRHGYVYDIHEPREPHLVARLGGFASYAYTVAFGPHSDTVAVGSSDYTARVWSLSHRHWRPLGSALLGANGDVFTVSFSPDGRMLATGSNDGVVRTYRVGGSRFPQRSLQAAGLTVFAVAFRPDGKGLAAAGRSGSVTNWTSSAAAYAKIACRSVADPITRSEWNLYVPGRPYDPPCR